jgi:PIN domain nuclease of toxin-antitoxin system
VASLLLDTCTLLWLAADPSRLSPDATEALDDEANELWVSDVSTLEIALKWSAGKLTLPTPPRTWFESQVATWELSTIGLRRPDIYRTTELPAHHRDPFDRLLIAQALDRGFTIVTPDEAVVVYPVATLW